MPGSIEGPGRLLDPWRPLSGQAGRLEMKVPKSPVDGLQAPLVYPARRDKGPKGPKNLQQHVHTGWHQNGVPRKAVVATRPPVEVHLDVGTRVCTSRQPRSPAMNLLYVLSSETKVPTYSGFPIPSAGGRGNGGDGFAIPVRASDRHHLGPAGINKTGWR